MLNLSSWEEVAFPENIDFETITIASGYLAEQTFVGDFEAKFIYSGFFLWRLT